MRRSRVPGRGEKRDSEVHSLADRWSRRTQRRGLVLTTAAMVAASIISIAAPPQATANVAQAWGSNSSGQLGDGTTVGPEKCGAKQNACSTSPVGVSGLSGVTAVAGGSEYSLALLENGTVTAWGYNLHGQLGDGTKTSSAVPVAVKELGEVAGIAAGGQHSLALLKNGTVVAWGSNSFGQLGNGGTADSDVPVAVKELSGVVAIAAGGEESLAVLESGVVMAWGENSEGQLGNGSKVSSNVPVAVCAAGPQTPCPTGPYLTGVTAVAAGSAYSMARLSGGAVMAWGGNTQGQLGNGTETGSDVPVAVCAIGTVGPCPSGPYLSGVKSLAAGGFGPNDGGLQSYSLALLESGRVAAWGVSERGELGDGSSTGPEKCDEMLQTCSKTPLAVSGLSGVTTVAARGAHSLALLENGAVMSWGDNKNGQLGDGMSSGPEPCGGIEPTACSATPVAVATHGGVALGIAAGDEHSLAFGPQPPPPNLPEAGRCVKVTAGSGHYKSINCTTPATGRAGKYEWTAASATEKQAFLGSGLETTLTTAGHSTIKCIDANFEGEWTGPKTASVSLELQGCVNPSGQQCQSSRQTKSEIKLFPVEGQLGFIKYEEIEGKLKIAVGLDLKPQPPLTQLGSYECTGSAETGHLQGSVIGRISPINTMTTSQNLLYAASKAGEQRPEAFQGTPKDTLTTSFTAGLEENEGSGASSLNIKSETGHNAAPLEIKAK
jgi:alpha-tubulin suppressor-like RCC1 family protein